MNDNLILGQKKWSGGGGGWDLEHSSISNNAARHFDVSVWMKMHALWTCPGNRCMLKCLVSISLASTPHSYFLRYIVFLIHKSSTMQHVIALIPNSVS